MDWALGTGQPPPGASRALHRLVLEQGRQRGPGGAPEWGQAGTPAGWGQQQAAAAQHDPGGGSAATRQLSDSEPAAAAPWEASQVIILNMGIWAPTKCVGGKGTRVFSPKTNRVRVVEHGPRGPSGTEGRQKRVGVS